MALTVWTGVKCRRDAQLPPQVAGFFRLLICHNIRKAMQTEVEVEFVQRTIIFMLVEKWTIKKSSILQQHAYSQLRPNQLLKKKLSHSSKHNYKDLTDGENLT